MVLVVKRTTQSAMRTGMIFACGAPPTKSVKPVQPGELPASLLPASRLSVPVPWPRLRVRPDPAGARSVASLGLPPS